MLAAVVFCLSLLLTLRLVLILHKIRYHRTCDVVNICTKQYSNCVKCLFVAGSGGHTSELLRLVGSLRPEKFFPRHYVVAATDRMSEEKINSFEKQRKCADLKQYAIDYIARSREVKQSWTSTVWSTLVATIQAFPLVFRIRPNVVLVNGPGTCIPICLAAFCLTMLGKKVHIIFVESICRVQTMSLSGRLLYYIADQFFVHWPELHARYPLTRHLGRIV